MVVYFYFWLHRGKAELLKKKWISMERGALLLHTWSDFQIQVWLKNKMVSSTEIVLQLDQDTVLLYIHKRLAI